MEFWLYRQNATDMILETQCNSFYHMKSNIEIVPVGDCLQGNITLKGAKIILNGTVLKDANFDLYCGSLAR